jgi:hypothetical protein
MSPPAKRPVQHPTPQTPLIWLDYTSLRTTWQSQNAWATGLTLSSYVLLPEYSGYQITWTENSWRLPTTVPPVTGYDRTDSEMGHLYYTELGNQAYTLSATAPFTNLRADRYWSGTEYSIPLAWAFVMGSGNQTIASKIKTPGDGLAVRAGQLEASAVPEITSSFTTLVMIAGGLMLRRRTKHLR